MASAYEGLDSQMAKLGFTSYVDNDWDKTIYYTKEIWSENPESIRLQMMEILECMKRQMQCFIMELLAEDIMQFLPNVCIPFTMDRAEYKTIHIKCSIQEE